MRVETWNIGESENTGYRQIGGDIQYKQIGESEYKKSGERWKRKISSRISVASSPANQPLCAIFYLRLVSYVGFGAGCRSLV